MKKSGGPFLTQSITSLQYVPVEHLSILDPFGSQEVRRGPPIFVPFHLHYGPCSAVLSMYYSTR